MTDGPITEAEKKRRDRRYCEAAEHIRQTIPMSDMGGRMVMAAFLKDSIDHEETAERT